MSGYHDCKQHVKWPERIDPNANSWLELITQHSSLLYQQYKYGRLCWTTGSEQAWLRLEYISRFCLSEPLSQVKGVSEIIFMPPATDFSLIFTRNCSFINSESCTTGAPKFNGCNIFWMLQFLINFHKIYSTNDFNQFINSDGIAQFNADSLVL